MKQGFEKRVPVVTLNNYRSGIQVVIGKFEAEFQAGAVRADMLWMANISPRGVGPGQAILDRRFERGQ